MDYLCLLEITIGLLNAFVDLNIIHPFATTPPSNFMHHGFVLLPETIANIQILSCHSCPVDDQLEGVIACALLQMLHSTRVETVCNTTRDMYSQKNQLASLNTCTGKPRTSHRNQNSRGAQQASFSPSTLPRVTYYLQTYFKHAKTFCRSSLTTSYCRLTLDAHRKRMHYSGTKDETSEGAPRYTRSCGKASLSFFLHDYEKRLPYWCRQRFSGVTRQ